MQRETLVLLPGMMCDARLFAPQVAHLAGDHDIVIPSLTECSIEAMARSVMDQLDPDCQVNLCGLSMGGIVAMEICRLFPERVARLALFDTNHHADPPERKTLRQRQIADVTSGRLRDVIIDEMKPNYLAAAHRDNTELLDLLITMAMDQGPEIFIAQSHALMNRRDQTEMLSAFSGPALVLCGAEDALCPPSRHEEMASLLSESRLLVMADAGHISTLEQPDAVTVALRAWLREPVG